MPRSPVPSSRLAVAQRLLHADYQSLWIAGDPTALEPPLVAIVGTREADTYGAALAREFAMALAKQHVGVVSGGALGIDAAAHAGALDAGGRTAVVLPSGLDQLYPLRHKPMYEEIVARGGALVSPFPPETPPARWTFPRRNALLAALCDLLV
ncbi:MAG: DNA-processing protein DprA, partial [Deltaproteobacteria bacterium]